MGTDSDRSALVARVRVEWKLASKHLGPKAYAELLGVTVPELKQLRAEAGTLPQVVRWSQLSEPVLRAVFDAFIRGREVAARFCSRHGYSVGGFTKAISEQWPDEWAMVTEDKRPKAANLYQMGRSLEQRIRLKLLAAGWFVVRSAGSHTEADLVAAKDGVIWLVQCKRSGALPPAEWNALIDAAAKAGGVPVMVENPHAGAIRWWALTSKKNGRGTGTKDRLPAPVELAEIDLAALERQVDEEERLDSATEPS